MCAFLYISLLAILVLSCLSPVSAQSGALRQQADADWSPRSESSAYSNPLPQLVQTVEGLTFIPAGSVWVYGGVDSNGRGLSDVWVTTDSAKSWTQVMSDRTVTDVSRSADCYSHQTGRVYALTGSTPGSGDQRTSRIVASNDGVNWEIVTEDAPFLARERPGCTVDSQGNVYIFGGSTRSLNGGSTGPTNDVWVSRTLGLTWQRVSARANWVQRISTDAQTHTSSAFNKDIIYIANGDSGRVPTGSGFQNDVWVSSDSARSFYRVTAAAPFDYRKDAELSVTKDGVLVVSGGDNDLSNVNDIWASLDGGYTWGACCVTCGYAIREDHFGGFDANGYFLLMGGIGSDNVWNDVWRSTFSFNDPAAVSQYCKIPVPADGVGLRCFPNGEGGCTSDSPGRLPGSGSGLSGLSGVMVGGIVVGVVIAVLILALCYRYKTKQPHDSLLPFFGSKSSEGATTGGTSDQYGKL